jgi:pimeloyl-ACP methyl ester carboxylesterase
VAAPWRTWLEQLNANAYARRQPLVLLNGLCEQPESWFRNLGAWRRYFDVFLPNLLVYDGDALHQRIDAGLPVSVDYLVDQLHLYLEQFVQAPRCHLVAASLGGKVAVEYAARHPARVARMVLLCSSGLGDAELLPIVEGVRRGDTKALVESAFHDPRRADPRLLQFYRGRFADRRWRTGLLRTIRGTLGHCVRDRLPMVQAPTLLVSGREDQIVDPRTAAEAARLLPQGYHVALPRCGHAPQMEHPRFINRLVAHFLGSPRPSVQVPLRPLALAGVNTLL